MKWGEGRECALNEAIEKPIGSRVWSRLPVIPEAEAEKWEVRANLVNKGPVFK